MFCYVVIQDGDDTAVQRFVTSLENVMHCMSFHFKMQWYQANISCRSVTRFKNVVHFVSFDFKMQMYQANESYQCDNPHSSSKTNIARETSAILRYHV